MTMTSYCEILFVGYLTFVISESINISDHRFKVEQWLNSKCFVPNRMICYNIINSTQFFVFPSFVQLTSK